MRRLLRLWRTSGSDLRLLMTALRDSSRPQWLMPATVMLALFAIDPFNFAIPVVGVVDDLVLLPLLLRWLVRAATASRAATVVTSPPRATLLLKQPRR